MSYAFAEDVKRAMHIIAMCERDLKYKLSDGEKRDLLKDNTRWSSEYVSRVVDAIGE